MFALEKTIAIDPHLQSSPQDRRQRLGKQPALRLLPLPARNERGEGRGEGKALKALPENDLVFRPPLPYPAHEPPARSRRGNEADSLGRQLLPPQYFGGYEVQRCQARRWFSGN